MAANRDGTWELIDGAQRLNSLIHFMENKDQLRKFGFKKSLTLGDLEVLTEFNDCSFDDIPHTLIEAEI